MSQQSADILGYHLILDIEVDQAIPFMTQPTIIEIAVEREERWSVQLMQQSNEFVIFHALSSEILTNLSHSDTLESQQGSLALGNVLIQDVHAGRDSSAYSAAWSSKARWANCTASAMASL